eukprot:COSAG02_NODE_47272_length_342_cov_1.008230_1_plen_50_part_01
MCDNLFYSNYSRVLKYSIPVRVFSTNPAVFCIRVSLMDIVSGYSIAAYQY